MKVNWPYVRKIAKEKGWLWVYYAFAISPFLFVWVYTGRGLVIAGEWMVRTGGAI